jgi:uncharacterized protein (TIGR03437 family)
MKKHLLLLLLCAGIIYSQTAETIPFRAVLLPTNEVPVANIDASGAATVLVHIVRDQAGQVVSGSVDFLVTHTFPGATNFTGLHIHRGEAGANGPVTIDSGIAGANPVVSDTGRGRIERQGHVRPGAANYQAALDTLNGLLTNPGSYYVNLHTTQFPGGAIRGQVMPAQKLVLLGQMSSAKEVPALSNIDATGLGAITAYVTRDSQGSITSGEVIFDIAYNLPEQANLSGLHIHRGTAAEAGPVTIGTDISGSAPVATPASGAGTVRRIVEVNLANAAQRDTLERLFVDPVNFYVNLHTTASPGGIIRSQLTPAEQFRFPVRMSTANEVPPVNLDASAPGALTVYALRDANAALAAGVVEFDVNYRFPGSVEFTGFHIHNGTATENGGVTINTGLSGANSLVSESGFGNITRTALVTGGAGLATLNSMMATPERHYVNLHSTVNTGGVVRAQVGEASSAAPAVSAVISAVSDPARTTIAPGGLFTVFGSNLARVSGNLGAFAGRTLPAALNGVSVTLANGEARLIQVSPTFLVAQAPFETTAGAAPVVVTTPTGRSTAFNVTVAASAPAIFFDADGAIATDLNYRLIRANNPAAAGDQVWVYSTGMGQASPALQTGALAADASSVSGVTATVGGRAARVVASVASPGFAGLYQTLLEIPAGTAAGNQAIVLMVGGNSSNAAAIPVR